MDSTKKPHHPPFDPVVADRLLSRLAEDDDFRELFASDPQGRRLGHQPASAFDAAAALAGASCMKVQRLASKEEIQACQEALQRDLTSAAAYTVVHSLDAGTLESKLRDE